MDTYQEYESNAGKLTIYKSGCYKLEKYYDTLEELFNAEEKIYRSIYEEDFNITDVRYFTKERIVCDLYPITEWVLVIDVKL